MQSDFEAGVKAAFNAMIKKQQATEMVSLNTIIMYTIQVQSCE